MNKNRSYSIECGDGYVLILDKTEINSEVENTFISHFSNFFNLFSEWPVPKSNWYDYTQPLSELSLPQNNQQIESELLFSATPELNKEITITYRVTPSINMSQAQMQMWLFVPSKGFELVDARFPSCGEIRRGSWIGNINNGQTVEINATYRITSTGWGNVEGQLLVQRGGEVTDTIVDVKMADLSVDKEGGKVTPRERKLPKVSKTVDFHVTEPVITPEPVLPPTKGNKNIIIGGDIEK